MFISKRILLCGLSAPVMSLLYLPVYIRTRRADELKNTCRENLQVKLLMCCVFNIMISFVLLPFSRFRPEMIFAFALMIITDLDILICRIPTEFLVLLYASLLPEVITNADWKYVIFCLVLWAFWWAAGKKRIITDQDIRMILPLVLYLNEIKKALLFTALFLILWGCTGLVLRYICGKSPYTKIPLVPLMVISFLLMQPVL